LNLLIRSPEHFILSALPSPNIPPLGYSTLRPALRGIFTLVKDEINTILPLTRNNSIISVFNALKQAPFISKYPDLLLNKAFQTASEISRQFPVYELHFRKSPDFWNIIDEQFPY
jgi:hypothetical protein